MSPHFLERMALRQVTEEMVLLTFQHGITLPDAGWPEHYLRVRDFGGRRLRLAVVNTPQGPVGKTVLWG